MNGLGTKSVNFDVVDLPVDDTAPWRHAPSPSGEGHAFGPHDPGPGNAQLEWVLGLQHNGQLVAMMWLREPLEGASPSLGVASASILANEGHALIRLLEAGLNRVAAGNTGHVTVRLPLERSATLDLLQHIGFTMRSLLVFGGMAEAELDLPGRNDPD